ncbi:hypothetical protein F9Z43_23905 [Pseudomonas monteilii]|uniref:Uncharacterized protein n=1 Tax=Pseudomonas monteilii TaxID=76759 RepID=A0A7X3F6R7_9PSED|nr:MULTISPECIES: hypothetical protein [Pseudomonas]MCA4076231.1 hypothetical protein [Pseudomonas kurunegalensis]MVF52291.1 hypothetical protein [Pseudomonas monteilii]
MTMISGYKLKEGGFLQADILLTSSNKRMRPSQIPSFTPDAGSPALRAHAVAGLCQKILVVNDHFAVAFAGDVRSIQAVVRLIERLVDEQPVLTGKRFSDAVLADDTIDSEKIRIIVLSVEDDEIHISNVYADCGHRNENFELWVGGSGAGHVKAHYQDYPPHAFDVLEENIVVHGACMALDQFASHLKSEFENKYKSESIASLFGGGYEVVAFYDGRFQKISNIVYAFADAELDAEGMLQVDFPKCLIKSEYDGEDLKIRSVELQFDEDFDEYVPVNDRTFTISRYEETSVEDDVDELRFRGQFLCFLINYKTEKGAMTIPFIKKYENDFYFLFKVFTASVEPGFVQINYSDIFRGEVNSHVLRLMEQLKASFNSK